MNEADRTNDRRGVGPFRKSFLFVVVSMVLLLGVAGCSPDGNDDDDPTPTAPPPVGTPTSTPLPPVPTATVTPRDTVAVIKVNGNGIEFGGTITDAAGNSRTVEGIAPQEFVATALQGRTVVGSFFKKTAGRDYLQAVISYQGQILATQETNTDFGSVTVVGMIP